MRDALVLMAAIPLLVVAVVLVWLSEIAVAVTEVVLERID